MTTSSCSFAYLNESFPSFVKTFVYREAVEMVRQQMAPLIVSVRRPDEAELAVQVPVDVLYLPEKEAVRVAVQKRAAANQLEPRAKDALARHHRARDWQRLLEAIWLAPVLKSHGVEHVHAHFGGLATRTAWWLREIFGFTYSYTGHANDIFCDTDLPLKQADLAGAAELIVTETDYARQWMEERYPSARGKVYRVFNGLDLDGFLAREEPGPVPNIVSVGRCVEKKGFDVLIDACALLRQRGIAFMCEIIGDGPLRDELAAQIARRGVGDRVRLAGARSQSEVRRKLAAAQVFVLACQPDREGGSDNLPTAVAEAMLAGAPVISTRIAGVPEMIRDGETGLLVPVRDPGSLAEAMARLLADRALARRLADHGRTTAQTNFSIEETTKQLKRLLVRHGRVKPPPLARAFDPDLLCL